MRPVLPSTTLAHTKEKIFGNYLESFEHFELL